METRCVMARASEAAVAIVRGIGPGEFGGSTPCPELRIGALLNHLIFWTSVRGHAAGLKQPPQALADEVAEGHDFTAEPDWAETYAARSAATAAVWSDPRAWAGETALTGSGRMPARFIGGIVLGEWLLHGWDLAAATGQKLNVDEELAAALYEDIAGKADMARQFGVFGPEVGVPATAPLFDRALGLAGRDPSWRRRA
ncbi:TIGR03086 family metal-binding protein [Streptomyces sp. NBC_00481]|uniref:TIGR03086 family metal-binding protein n=1 Tax=unclassified Streptomyces TaxID=2593676 RepID=UPI002DD95586|nr:MULTISPECIES: TIGR03086 family metal-binding protein [unclassified Streptomyces]WRY93613.1 TIGR03086 family metal-binding protein [Streptomyces sp. NBC_00481]